MACPRRPPPFPHPASLRNKFGRFFTTTNTTAERSPFVNRHVGLLLPPPLGITQQWLRRRSGKMKG